MDPTLEEPLNLESSMHVEFDNAGIVVSSSDVSLNTNEHGSMPMEFENFEEQAILMEASEEEVTVSEFMKSHLSKQEFTIDVKNTNVTTELDSKQNVLSQSDSIVDFQFHPQTQELKFHPRPFEVKVSQAAISTTKKKHETVLASMPRQVPIAPKPPDTTKQNVKTFVGKQFAIAPKPVTITNKTISVKKIPVSSFIQRNIKGNTLVGKMGKQIIMMPAGSPSPPKVKVVPPRGGLSNVQYITSENNTVQLIPAKSISGQTTFKQVFPKFVTVQGQPKVTESTQSAVITKMLPGIASTQNRLVSMQQKTVPITIGDKVYLASPGKQLNKRQEVITIANPLKQMVHVSKSNEVYAMKTTPKLMPAATKKVVITAKPKQNVVFEQLPKTVQITKNGDEQNSQVHQINIPGKGLQCIKLVSPTSTVMESGSPSPQQKTFIFTDSKGNVIQMTAEKMTDSQPPPLVITGKANEKMASKAPQKLVRIAPHTHKDIQLVSIPNVLGQWTMEKIIVFLLILIKHLQCEEHQDRPKISSSDGHITIQAAFEKNIYLRPNGVNSGIYVGEVNILNITKNSNKAQYSPVPSVDISDEYDSILRRLQRLERQILTSVDNSYMIMNISLLTRRVNRLAQRISDVQNIVSARGNECNSRPCQNGGTCLNLLDGYHCLCPSNWEGHDCDLDVNECHNFAGTQFGCQHGECINKPGTYECLCTSGWYGMHCTRRQNDCSGGNNEMCGNGQCIPTSTGHGYTCICNRGWTTNGTGVDCRTDVDECDSSQGAHCSVNPKVECINTPGSFRCGQCPVGYEGDGFVCTDIDECLTRANGGCSTSPMVTCHNTVGSRICGPCPPGYVGNGETCTWRGACNINHGGCHPSAQCVENAGPQTAQCVCPASMEGDGVGIHGCYVPSDNSTLRCETNPCNSGYCIPLQHGYTCVCFKGYSGPHCESRLDYCSSNPCQNGGTCTRDDGIAKGFRCECMAQFSGELCQVMSKTCGGIVDAPEGSIVYPLFNNTFYNNNAACAWVIRTTPNKVINVTFTRFNVEENPDCAYDFLQIHDGRSSASQIIGRFCGNVLPKGGNIVSNHNNLYLWFRSDGSVSKSGFALHWTSVPPVCGGEINATVHGSISSPGSPGTYPPNRDCYWHLVSRPGQRIQLHFFELDIQSHNNCSFDFLSVYDGSRSSDPLLAKFCSTIHPAPVISSSYEMLIHFHSDGSGSGHGFQISFAPTEGIPGCGGYFTTERGVINSPTDNGKYLHNLFCEYKIKTSPDTKIQLNFISFNLEVSRNCLFDYLKVYDGETSEYPLIGKFCGTTYPKTIMSNTNTIFLIFRSDSSSSSEGFHLTYDAVCQQNIVGDSGVIKSPGYPFNYPHGKSCVYIISTLPGRAIQLFFQDFDVEGNRNSNCMYDSVEIRDGPNMNSTSRGKFCGDALPPAIISTHNYLYIKFTTDISISGRGFYANYTTIDVECGGIYRDDNQTIHHPSENEDNLGYKNDQTCIWWIIAPDDKHLKLSWNSFDLEESTSCELDYVEILEVDQESNKTSVGRFCGDNLPPAITVMTNQVIIKFVSDSSVRLDGFSLSYSFLDNKNDCDATLMHTHGYIYSPGWPNRYPTNRDCVWTITAPIGQQISLNISQFNLERPLGTRCTYGDFLEIRNGPSASSPLIGQYCGLFSYKKIVSLSNSLYLKFHSDFAISGFGFQIEWDATIVGCGGTLITSSGSLSSPNYPSNYYDNAECFYRIITSAGSRINISFIDLDIEESAFCGDDYVEVFDGRDANAQNIGHFCRMQPEARHIETKSNSAFIKFRSDYMISHRGFLLNYNTLCNNNLTGTFGIIESPGFPNPYDKNLNCSWTIHALKGHKINITFTHIDIHKSNYIIPRWYSNRPHHTFDLRPHWPSNRLDHIFDLGPQSACTEDYLQIKETKDLTYVNRFCGSELPYPFNSVSNSVQINFISSPSSAIRSGGSFRLEWVAYGCGGHIQKKSGDINFHKSSESELECEWLIEAPLSVNLFVSISKVIMFESKNCSIDSIEVFNGPNSNFPLISKICHDKAVTVESSSNIILLKLTKQSSLRDIYFDVVFTSLKARCGGYIESVSGFIYSHNYPKNYDNNMDCIWSIEVPLNHRIELNFMDLDLFGEDAHSCEDFVNIYDGLFSVMSNYSKRICPGAELTSFISKSNVLALQFVTNGRDNAKGFKANFTAICGATITAISDGVIKNDRFIGNLNTNCTWVIQAPKLYEKISLTITHLSIPRNGSVANKRCPSSFLKVYDGDDNNAPLIDEYCGRRIPVMIVSRGSALTIEFGTYEGGISGTFSAHFTSLSTACGGVLTSEEGTIASPNYPLSYPPHADCEWILTTSPGNKVYITFEQLDIVYSENCNQDYLEIRDDSGSGNILGLYCNNELPTNRTIGSNVFIKFHSDDKDTARGFVLHYEFQHSNNIIEQDHGIITSPLYPFKYEGECEYSWRIMAVDRNPLSIIVNQLEIHVHGSLCYNYLAIFDGYDEEAPLINKLCGVVTQDNMKIMKSSANVVYIKLKLDNTNTGSLFRLNWANGEKDIEQGAGKINCGNNETYIQPGKSVTVATPNYPQNYNPDLNCEWLFKTSKGRYLTVEFSDFAIEETSSCFADHISVFSSDNGVIWKPISENVCTLNALLPVSNASTYLKITFHTDDSIEKKGFQAIVKSSCGGSLTDSSGIIAPSWLDWKNNRVSFSCQWKIKVRPGHTIKIYFDKFNITSSNDHCGTFLTLYNGDSAESPFLGNGRYCGLSHESLDSLESSSNSIFVRYFNQGFKLTFETFQLRFEEQNIECGGTSSLNSEHSWEIINSPNYPSVPLSYSECEWVFTGPPGEILRVDFIERFDLDRQIDCQLEFIEIRDGSSAMSPLKGKYCGDKPGTIKTSNNIVYIKYVTQLLEPRDGFKANISIDVCGGTIIAARSELTSPDYPRMKWFPPGSICEWRIISLPGRSLQITMLDFDLPETDEECASSVKIEETNPVNKSLETLKVFCPEEYEDTSVIETSTNEVTIKLTIGKTSRWASNTVSRGFKIVYNSTKPTCGGRITQSEGFLTTPWYPRDTTVRLCLWKITVPDVTRRIRFEILDSEVDSGRHRIGVFDDDTMHTPIFLSGTDSMPGSVFESTGNRMGVYLWFLPMIARHHFKAKFSSYDEALCGGSLSGQTGELTAPKINRPYSCTWNYKYEINMQNEVEHHSSLVQVTVNTSVNRTLCRYGDSRLDISSYTNNLLFTRSVCGVTDKALLRIPSADFKLIAVQSSLRPLYFSFIWKLQPCGGLVRVAENRLHILNAPANYNDTLDCSWLIVIPYDYRIEIKLEGSFQFNCDDEFIKIRSNSFKNSPIIGDYCKTKTQTDPLLIHFRNLYVEYHSVARNQTNLNITITTTSKRCGGLLHKYETSFSSPNYPKQYSNNQECIWEIEADLGSRVSVRFVDRFAIEKRPNCDKDVVLIYDWTNESYVELARLCGRELPSSYNSTNNRMKVVFRSDAEITLEGFTAEWTAICGGNYVATEIEHYLYSPGYPDYYPSLLECKYVITAPEGSLNIRFLDFELEGPYPECEYDNITITSVGYYEDVEVYCDKKIPPPTTNNNRIQLLFRSDSGISFKGFKLAFSVYKCGGVVTNETILTSGPLSKYENNMNCTWTIQAPQNKRVVLKFNYIDVEGIADCYSDYIAVYDGVLIDFDKRLALMCGHVNSSTVIRSTGNQLLLNFITDSSITYSGFKAEVTFTFTEAVGCGGKINLLTPYVLRSPLFGNNSVYENFLYCHWIVTTPSLDQIIRIEFTKFHIAPCENINQTALGLNCCDCDYVELNDGFNLDSLNIGKFCGHDLPPSFTSTANVMSIVLSTDGEINSAGFEARLSVEQSICGRSVFQVSNDIQVLKSPGYNNGNIPNGLRCSYHFDATLSQYKPIRVVIKNLDIKPPAHDRNECIRDRLLIKSDLMHNSSLGKDYIYKKGTENFFVNTNKNDASYRLPESIIMCGARTDVDIYIYNSFTVNIVTSPYSDTVAHRGFELDVSFSNLCDRNYTSLQGRISVSYSSNAHSNTGETDCYVLISVPETYTISLYFMDITPDYNSDAYLEILDGSSRDSVILLNVTEYDDINRPVFSHGRNILIHNHGSDNRQVEFDMNYVATNKGRGCGGSLHNQIGKITSPLYPETYRQKGSCEWELETHVGTRLLLHFTVFDLGVVCDQNYVQLINRNGQTIGTYCSETPADFSSNDNYVKIVFTTSMNNMGTGWVAEFISVVL